MALYTPNNLRLLEEMKPLYRLPPIERVVKGLPDGFLPPANWKGAPMPTAPPVTALEKPHKKSKKEKKEELKASASGGVAALTAGKIPSRKKVKDYLMSRIDELGSD